MYEIIGDGIRLQFALKTDMRNIYEMMVSDEIGQFMFDEEYPAPTWVSFREREKDLFPEMASSSGSYLLIIYEGKTAGAISFVCGFDKKPYAELNIWLAGYEYMGKSIGCNAITLLRSFIHRTYDIEEFIIRSWTKNLSAIQTYNRCGFYESTSFRLRDYYSEADMSRKGAGDYGPKETLNLYCNYVEELV